MTDKSSDQAGTCEICDRELPPARLGRRRRTCSDACRQALYRRRRLRAALGRRGLDAG